MARLRALMDAKGWTQVALAERSGLSQQVISRYLRGSWPTPPALVQLARAFDCSLNYLLTGQEWAATAPPRDMGVAAPLAGAQAVRPRAPAAKRGRRAG